MIVRLDRGLAFARYRVTAAKVGPLRYEDGSVEQVPIETLRASAASLVGKPVTVDHLGGERLDPEPDEIVGRVVTAHVDGEELVAEIEVTDPRVIEAIDSGYLTELSPGYEADVRSIDGELVQTRREYGHLALGPAGWARCGGACSVQARTDGACSCGGACVRPRPQSRLDAVQRASREWGDAANRGEARSSSGVYAESTESGFAFERRR